MHVATYAAFRDELEKLAYHSAVDIAGLGILAAPTIQKMRGKPMSERGTHAAELGGLGVLAGSSAHKIYSGMKDAAQGAAKGGKLRAALRAIKHASAEPGLADGALSLFKEAQGMGQVMGSFGAGTGKLLHDTARRAVSGGGKSLAERVAARRAQMQMIARKANPVTTLPSSGKVIHASVKEAGFFGNLAARIGGGVAKATPKPAFKPSFAGHAKSLGVGTNVAKSGIETTRSFDPLRQTLQRSKAISIPGLTNP